MLEADEVSEAVAWQGRSPPGRGRLLAAIKVSYRVDAGLLNCSLNVEDMWSIITGHNWETVYSLAFQAAEAGILQ
jgi:hypothetical protein